MEFKTWVIGQINFFSDFMKRLCFKMLICHFINLTLAIYQKTVYIEIQEIFFIKKQDNGKFGIVILPMCFSWIIFQECWVFLLKKIMNKTFFYRFTYNYPYYLIHQEAILLFQGNIKISFQLFCHHSKLSFHYITCKLSGLELL